MLDARKPMPSEEKAMANEVVDEQSEVGVGTGWDGQDGACSSLSCHMWPLREVGDCNRPPLPVRGSLKLAVWGTSGG